MGEEFNTNFEASDFFEHVAQPPHVVTQFQPAGQSGEPGQLAPRTLNPLLPHRHCLTFRSVATTTGGNLNCNCRFSRSAFTLPDHFAVASSGVNARLAQ